MEEAQFRDSDFHEIILLILISDNFLLFRIHPVENTVKCQSAVNMVTNFWLSSKVGDTGLAK